MDTKANTELMDVMPLIAKVAEANRKRTYLSFDHTDKTAILEAEGYLAKSAKPALMTFRN